jgi:hypothetical protein
LSAARDVSLLHTIQTCFGAHPSSYPVGTGVLFLGIKWSGDEADHSPPSSVEVKNVWIQTSTPHMSSWHSAKLINVFFLLQFYNIVFYYYRNNVN